MNEERYQRAKAIFIELTDADPAARAGLLAARCGDDEALRAEVQALLDNDAPTPPSPAGQGGDGAAPESLVGETLERFRIVGVLGQGGFGVVYEAEQLEPVRREVALKVIRPGFGSGEIVRRFEAERQALALMDHPNVAGIFDAGTLPDGRPFFAMELVRGEPITAYCERVGAGVRERLELFLGVCEAVRHAHAKGIIHRDLKPANILVSDDPPRARVIDFGIAKALDGPLTGATLATERGAMVGTPEYMSPEQAGFTPTAPDTRIDVYALGVVLYELLTGLLPFDRERLRAADLAEIQRIIRDETPPRPSVRVQRGVTATGGTARLPQSRALRGDLDWIVMRCLEKDAGRRYATVDALGADIRRYLRGEPVEAGPPSASYRAGKFLKRHKTAAAAAGVVLIVLVASAAVSTGLALSEARQRAEAERRGEEASRLAAFQASIITGLDPAAIGVGLREALREDLRRAGERAGLDEQETAALEMRLDEALDRVNITDVARRTLAEQILDATDPRIGDEFGDQPAIEASLRMSLAMAYEALGRFDAAVTEVERSRAIHEQIHGPDHPETLQAVAALGWYLGSAGRHAEAVELLEPNLERARSLLGDDARPTIDLATSLGSALSDAGSTEEAERWLRFAINGADRTLEPTDPLIFRSRERLAFHLVLRGSLAEAEAAASELVQIRTNMFGATHPDTLAAENSLGVVQRRLGRQEDAAETFGRILGEARSSLGESHPETLTYMYNLGMSLRMLNRWDEARLLMATVRDERRRVLGKGHPETIDPVVILSMMASTPEESEALAREVVEGYTAAFGPEHRNVFGSTLNLGMAVAAQDRYEEAIPLVRRACTGLERLLGQDHFHTLQARAELGEILRRAGEFDEAEATLRDVHGSFARQFGAADYRSMYTQMTLARALRDAGKPEESAEQFGAVLGHVSRSRGWCDGSTRDTLQELVVLEIERGHGDGAAAVLERAAGELEGTEGVPPECLAWLAGLFERLDGAAPGRGHRERAEALRSASAG